jgi:anthranilate phosphoribosyltransferase
MVVHSRDGLDEISPAAPTLVAELRAGEVTRYEIDPATFGLQSADLSGLEVDSADASAALIRAALAGDEGAENARRIIALNAGATIYVAGIAARLADGIALAEDLLSTGQAAEKLKSFVDFTQLVRGDRQA